MPHPSKDQEPAPVARGGSRDFPFGVAMWWQKGIVGWLPGVESKPKVGGYAIPYGKLLGYNIVV